ncbi:MAG: homocysteine S-methyltransferase [Sporomusaceae bacterium]|nr:homocysteine S-methyltransferase [Sporomusaceae bacterium]
MNPIASILDKFPVMILDGAFATELERNGCNLNDELWSAKVLFEQPELIKKVHLDYFKAGADCATSASYQASIEGFMRKGFSQTEAADLIRLAVNLAVEARDAFWAEHQTEQRPKPLVAASVGPYGAFLADGSEYRGDYTIGEAELVAFHKPRLELLIAGRPDLLACETIPCLAEAKVLATLLKEYPEMSAWVSFSAKDGLHISSGERVADCAAWLETQPQVSAIGINCTAPKYIPSLIAEIAANTSKPILLYPNSGEEYDATDKTWHGSSDGRTFGDSAYEWYQQGARIIGGCCRTTPQDIRSIAAWARK